jgi:hypothetical protein
MKQILSLFTAAFLFACISCGDNKTEKMAGDEMSSAKMGNSMVEKNLAASHIVNDAFKSGDISKIDDVIASDFC